MITCEHCNKEIKKYSEVAFSLYFLTEYLTDYFGVSVTWMLANSGKNPKHSKIKNVMVYILHKFSKKSMAYIINHFREVGYEEGVIVKNIRASIADEKNVDLIFIDKDLSGQLPINLPD